MTSTRYRLYLALASASAVTAAVAWLWVGRGGDRIGQFCDAAGLVMCLCAVLSSFHAVRSGVDDRNARVSLVSQEKWAPTIITFEEIPSKDDHVYIGHGTRLTWQTAQAIYDMATAQNARRPEQWEQVIHTLLERGPREPIFLSIPRIFEHVRIHGGTGTGKSRMLELIAVQLARLSFFVPFLDPKGDERMVRQLYSVARTYEKRWNFFSPQMPKMSIAYNPLANFSEPRDIADRIKPLLPSIGEGEPYAQTQWEVVLGITNALVQLGRTPSFHLLRKYAEQGGRDGLFIELLRHTYPEGEWGNPKGAANTYQNMVVNLQSGNEVPAWFRARGPSENVGVLLKVVNDPSYYSKMITSLMPLLTKLSDGALRELLSPTDDRPTLSWPRAATQHAIAYLYMSALTGIETSGGLAKAAFLDLLNYLGYRFSYHSNLIASTRIILMADELGDLVVPEFISALNKGRAAGMAIVTACQTGQDIVAKLSRPRWEQIKTNTRTIIQFRTSETDAKDMSVRIGEAMVKMDKRQFRFDPALLASGHSEKNDFSGSVTVGVEQKWVPRVPPELFTSLPTGHFVVTDGSDVWLGEEPLLAEPQHDYIAEETARLGRGLPGRLGREAA